MTVYGASQMVSVNDSDGYWMERKRKAQTGDCTELMCAVKLLVLVVISVIHS